MKSCERSVGPETYLIEVHRHKEGIGLIQFCRCQLKLLTQCMYQLWLQLQPGAQKHHEAVLFDLCFCLLFFQIFLQPSLLSLSLHRDVRVHVEYVQLCQAFVVHKLYVEYVQALLCCMPNVSYTQAGRLKFVLVLGFLLRFTAAAVCFKCLRSSPALAFALMCVYYLIIFSFRA